MIDRIGDYVIDEEKLVSISHKIRDTKKLLDRINDFTDEISNIEIQNKHPDETGENLVKSLYIDAVEIPEMPYFIQEVIDKCKNVLTCKIEDLSNELIKEATGKYTKKGIGGQE